MSENQLQPRQALNKAYVKVKTDHESMRAFKESLVSLLDLSNESKSEEFNKGLLTDFLKKTYINIWSIVKVMEERVFKSKSKWRLD